VDAISQSDCIIAFGAGLNGFTTASGAYLDKKWVIQCNAEAAEAGKLVAPDIALVGDPAATADLIVHWLDEAEVQPSKFRNDDLDRALKAFTRAGDFADDKSNAETIDIRKALWRTGQAMPADRILATDGGRFVGTTYKVIQAPDPGFFVYTLHFASIGLGMAEAVGAAAADPSRPVLLVTGDGGFMLGGLLEFNSAVRARMGMVVVVCNDGAYGAEHIQFRRKNLDPAHSMFRWPDFAPIADALGGKGVTVRNDEDLSAALRAIAERDRSRPLLIDLKIDPENVPPVR
jgi:thiamine pyrophosphate-dependent acetolactate synthase large subunit-like protein